MAKEETRGSHERLNTEGITDMGVRSAPTPNKAKDSVTRDLPTA